MNSKPMLSNPPKMISNTADRKHRSYMKAELVRRELLSRGDLIKLYQPPIPMNQLPFSNPFYTKTIVTSQNKTQTAGFGAFVKDFNNSDYDPRGTIYSQPAGGT